MQERTDPSTRAHTQKYVILIAIPLQQWFRWRVPTLRFTYVVFFIFFFLLQFVALCWVVAMPVYQYIRPVARRLYHWFTDFRKCSAGKRRKIINWRWRQHVSPKRRKSFIKLRFVTSQKTVILDTHDLWDIKSYGRLLSKPLTSKLWR